MKAYDLEFLLSLFFPNFPNVSSSQPVLNDRFICSITDSELQLVQEQ